jgi:hypothetical protein
MQADALQEELKRRGLELLGVGQHNSNPEVLIVYLHGNAGQWANGLARQVISQVPNVLATAESVSTPAIVLVRVAIEGR